MKMKQISIVAATLVGALVTANAAVTVLTFEGVGDFNPVGNFYNGGGGGNLGIVFSQNALAIVDADAGGGGNFGGEPSPSTILFFLGGGAATLNNAAGFTTGFSFYYSAISNPGFINVFDGLNATGNLLATLQLPVTPSNGGDPNGAFSPFFPTGVSFSGTAMSVDFGGTANQIGFDDVTFGTDNPISAIPEPGSLVGLGCVLATGLGFRSRRQRPLSA